ncbi:ABC transporter permease [Hujiaoplasma nucleasis]|uniref:ABC transporter permease n=1 Tax=Hujiaoplasma nucleasis TaxID=2725268 RepID=A0A7L6N3A9_9MOLU|nr:ABC transporter permease [Hujiaoplasma nucleasis]QLY40756.1 ABC transporter permease [Hujiaoplasma nucleasis]
MAFFISQAMFFIIPLLIVALAGMFSEKSGTVNIALEGLMVIGAFVGTFFVNRMQAIGFLDGAPQFLLIISLLLAGIGGAVFSALLGFLAINMRANQVIGGTALNLLAGALAIFLARQLQENNAVQISYNKEVFRLKSGFLEDIFPNINYIFFDQAYITLYIGIIILIISTIVIYKTKFGLRLSACGEHPEAAQSVGINVYRYRWTGVIISGFLGGLGGLVYALPISVSFEGTVAGYGFLALAVLIFGQWKPMRILLAAIFFGMFKALSVTFFSFDWISNLIEQYESVIPFGTIFRILPYLATMVVLAISSKKSKAPKASGIPFNFKGN